MAGTQVRELVLFFFCVDFPQNWPKKESVARGTSFVLNPAASVSGGAVPVALRKHAPLRTGIHVIMWAHQTRMSYARGLHLRQSRGAVAPSGAGMRAVVCGAGG